MKKKALYISVAAMLFTAACTDVDVVNRQAAPMRTLTIEANRVALDKANTRSGIDASTMTSYWDPSDVIGVVTAFAGTTPIYPFTNQSAIRSASTSFSGEVPSATGQVVAFSPMIGVLEEQATDGIVKITIPEEQHPSLSGGDPDADILAASMVAVKDGMPASMTFSRLSAMVSVILKDASTLLAGEQVQRITFESSATPLAGGCSSLNLADHTLSIPTPYEPLGLTPSNSVTAYMPGYAIDGETGAMLSVWPASFPAGSTLTVSAVTENFKLTKALTLEENLVIKPNTVNIITVEMTDACIEEISAYPLPFIDHLDWLSTTDEGRLPSSLYTGWNEGQGTLRKGDDGSLLLFNTTLTTRRLELPAQFTVRIKEQTPSGGEYTIVAAGQSRTVTIPGSEEPQWHNFSFDAGTAQTSAVTISVVRTGGQYARLYGLEVTEGIAPSISDTPSEIIFSGGGSTIGIDFTVSHLGTHSVFALAETVDGDWLTHTAGRQPVGGSTVTLTAAANQTGSERTGNFYLFVADEYTTDKDAWLGSVKIPVVQDTPTAGNTSTLTWNDCDGKIVPYDGEAYIWFDEQPVTITTLDGGTWKVKAASDAGKIRFHNTSAYIEVPPSEAATTLGAGHKILSIELKGLKMSASSAEMGIVSSADDILSVMEFLSGPKVLDKIDLSGFEGDYVWDVSTLGLTSLKIVSRKTAWVKSITATYE